VLSRVDKYTKHVHARTHIHAHSNAGQPSQEQSEEWVLSGGGGDGRGVITTDSERERRCRETIERLGIHGGSLIEMREGAVEETRRNECGEGGQGESDRQDE